MRQLLIRSFIFLLLSSTGAYAGQQVMVSTIHLTGALSLDGLIVSDTGVLYGAEGYDGSRIYRINMDGTSETFSTGLAGPIDMDFDDHGILYVTTFGNRGVYSVSPSGVATRIATVDFGPSGIVLNRPTRDIYVSHFGVQPYSGNTVYRIDSSGAVTTFVQHNDLRSPVSLAIDDGGNLYTPNIGDAKLFRIDPAGSLSLLVTLPTSPALYNIGHIAFANGKLYVTGNTGRHYLYEVDLDGSYEIIAGTGVAGSQDGEGLSAQFNGPNGIAASRNGDTLFISELNNPSNIRVVTFMDPTGVTEGPGTPRTFTLLQNFPNPFNPSTMIFFTLLRSDQVRLSIHDIRGRAIRILADGILPPGQHRVDWDGADQNGVKVGSGTYFLSLETDGSVTTRKMLLVR